MQQHWWSTQPKGTDVGTRLKQAFNGEQEAPERRCCSGGTITALTATFVRFVGTIGSYFYLKTTLGNENLSEFWNKLVEKVNFQIKIGQLWLSFVQLFQLHATITFNLMTVIPLFAVSLWLPLKVFTFTTATRTMTKPCNWKHISK